MNINGRAESGPLGPLRAAALIAMLAGALGSVGLMLRAGDPPVLLRVLFTFWVLSPFVALLLADRVAARWPAPTRATLYSVMLVVTLGSLAIYGDAVARPPKSAPASMFVFVPPASWLLMAIMVPVAAFISGRLSRRSDSA